MDSSWTISPERLHELGRELSREIGELADAIAAVPRPASPRISAECVRSIIRARRLRDQFFRADLFADPAWDILLDLYACRLEGRFAYVTSACVASAVPPTTGLRWIRALERAGLVARTPDEADARRSLLRLTDEAVANMEEWLTAVSAVSPLST